MSPAHEARLDRERVAFARRLHTLQEQHGDNVIYMDQTTFQLWPKPTKTWQFGQASIAAPENMKFLSAVTLFGAVGRCLKEGKLYMTAPSTDITSVKRFLVELAGAVRDPYTKERPYLVLDNHSAHRTPKVREELSRFHALFQPAYSSPFNCQETVWAQLKREYFVRLHRRDSDLANDVEFRDMILQLCEDVPVSADNMLRANRRYIAQYLALGAEESSDSF